MYQRKMHVIIKQLCVLNLYCEMEFLHICTVPIQMADIVIALIKVLYINLSHFNPCKYSYQLVELGLPMTFTHAHAPRFRLSCRLDVFKLLFSHGKPIEYTIILPTPWMAHRWTVSQQQCVNTASISRLRCWSPLHVILE